MEIFCPISQLRCIYISHCKLALQFAVTNWQFENLALHLQRQVENLALYLQRQIENLALHLQREIENLALHLQRQVEILALHLQGQIEKLALQSYFSSLFAEQCQTSLNKKRYRLYGASINTDKPDKTVKLLNETQNIWVFARHLRNIDQIFPLILRKVIRSDWSGH